MIKFNLRDEKPVSFNPTNTYCWARPFLAELEDGVSGVVICAKGVCIYFVQNRVISFSTAEYFTENYKFIRFLTTEESVTFTGEKP